MRAEVLSIGFCRTGCDLGWFSGALGEVGVELAAVSFVRAREAEAENALKDALARSQLVIVTGPAAAGVTDEISKKTIARALGKRLVLQSDLLKKVEASYAVRNQEPPVGSERVALLPAGSKAFLIGGLLGFFVEKAGKLVMYAPGMESGGAEEVIRELEGLLSQIKSGRRFERSRVLRCYGLDEGRARELLKDTGQAGSFSFYMTLEGLDVKASASADSSVKAKKALEELAAAAARRLGDFCYGTDTDRLEEVVARLLIRNRLTVATAESCTGGLLAKRLTDVPGSTAYMERGVVTYSNRSKEELLGVPARTIEDHGAVSKETAEAMAQGIRRSAKVDLGVSITGIAGPSGGTPTKPVGLVYIGLATPEGISVKGYNFPGERGQIRFASCQRALDILRRYLIA